MLQISENPPGKLRRARLERGVTLDDLTIALQSICTERGWGNGTLNRGEISKVERGLRWVKPEQVLALAVFFRVQPGRICEWVLADHGYLPTRAMQTKSPRAFGT